MAPLYFLTFKYPYNKYSLLQRNNRIYIWATPDNYNWDIHAKYENLPFQADHNDIYRVIRHKAHRNVIYICTIDRSQRNYYYYIICLTQLKTETTNWFLGTCVRKGMTPDYKSNLLYCPQLYTIRNARNRETKACGLATW